MSIRTCSSPPRSQQSRHNSATPAKTSSNTSLADRMSDCTSFMPVNLSFEFLHLPIFFLSAAGPVSSLARDFAILCAGWQRQPCSGGRVTLSRS